MVNVQSMVTLLRKQLVASRRQKVKLLAKEWLLSIPALLGMGRRQDIGEDLNDPPPETWELHESLQIDPDYFFSTGMVHTQDQKGDDGLIHVDKEYSVHLLNRAITYTNEATHRSIFNHHGERMDSLSYKYNWAVAPSKPLLPVSRTISGTTVNLFGNFSTSDGNYFHWLVDAMSRLFIAMRIYDLEEIDNVLVPPLKYDFHWDSLAAFGFDRSRIVELTALECMEFERLIATTPPRGKSSSIVPRWVMDGYDKTFNDLARNVKSIAGKRVYVSRRDSPKRMFVNEQDVCVFFEQRGFDIVELSPLDLPNKIAVFRDADVIISQTGAGLTNLMFCQSGAKLVEIVDRKYVYPSYDTITAFKGVDHYHHFFDSGLSLYSAMVSNVELDIQELENTLDSLGV